MIPGALYELADRTMAMLPDSFQSMVQALVHGTPGALQQVGRAGPRSALSSGGVAVIPIYGPISHRETLFSLVFGGTSCQQFSDALQRALADPRISAIVFDVDSPGGTVDGVPELSSEIFAARGKKPLIACCNAMAASAAYWIASSADQVVVSPSGPVGSIGVFAAHEDISEALKMEGITVSLVSAGKYKVEDTPYAPLSSEARASIQRMVDEFYGMFVAAVARNRDVAVSTVRNGFGEGRMLLAGDAARARMVDTVATLDQTVPRLLGRRTGKGLSPAAERSLRRRELELLM